MPRKKRRQQKKIPEATGIEPHSSELVALGLGSNLGLSESNLAAAIQQIAYFLDRPGVGPLYKSKPIPESGQPDYLNTVLVGQPRLAADEMLSLAKKLEWEAGRRPSPRNAARILDVDLLLWGNQSIETPELTVPHPQLRKRRFVLEPLAAIVPNQAVPPDGALVRDLLADLIDEQIVSRIAWTNNPL